MKHQPPSRFTVEREVHPWGGSRSQDVGSRSEADLLREIRGLRQELEFARSSVAKSQGRIRAALEATTDAVFSLDRQWRFTFLNQRALKELTRGEDLAGEHVAQMFPDLVGSVFWQRLSTAMYGDTSRTAEGYLPSLGAWYQVQATPTDDGLLVSCRNITRRKRAEEEQRTLVERWKSMLDTMPEIVWSMSSDGGEEYYNQKWVEFTGVDLSKEDRTRLELIHPDDRELAASRWSQSFRTGDPYECEYRLWHRSGEHRWVLSRARPEYNSGQLARWYGTIIDIHDRKRAGLALRQSESLSRGIIAASPDCVSLLDLDGNVIFVNAAVLRAYGTDDAGSLVGKRWGNSFRPKYWEKARHAVSRAQAGEVTRILVPPSERTSSWWDVVVAPVAAESGEITNIVVISRDVTHQKKAEEGVRWAAKHDMLTKLPNRIVLQQRMEQAISSASATGSNFALLLLDVDHFKQINDTLGHDAGDELLCTFATRLRSAVRVDDTVARLGGDEFAVLLNGVSSQKELDQAVKGILDAFREPCIYSGRMLDCHASIGASIYPQHGNSRVDLMKNADVALYAAKGAGRAKYKLFNPDMRAEAQKRSSMLSLAKEALQQDRIVPYYQPKINLRTGAVSGFEALLRWRHPTRGIQPPSTVTAAFEDLTLAAQISDRMIACAISDMRRWLDAGVDFGHVAVNAAAAEFRQGHFAERLLERLHEASIPPQHMQVEVTETVFLGRGADYVERALKTLSRERVAIALDDFGTGFASLSHLKQFPVDILKIDRSFVRDLHTDPDDGAIVDAVINLGRSLNMEVVAEGIETLAQHSSLAALGCHYGQGYLYGKAAPAARVPGLSRRCFLPLHAAA